MRIKSILIVCLISIGYVSAQYQDSYENNVNPYPSARSQYDSSENYAPQPRPAVQSYPTRSSSPSYSRPKAPIQPKVVAKLTAEEEEEAAAKEEEKKPSELELLLQNSKFSCGSMKDGYYADSSLNCQVFHYCVGGAKHSWQCPAGTVFHQVHLNCVPAAQDICSQSEKYHIVNEYLHKPIEGLGPNKTVRYHQRYYPDEFLGDPLAPNSGNSIQQYPPASSSRPSNYNSYEDETPMSYRQPNYSSNSVRSNKPQYSSYPQGYPQSKPTATKPKSYSSGNYPVSLISSPQPSRKPVSSYNDNYDDGSSSNYKPSSIYTQPAVRQPTYRQSNYQPNYSAAASSPQYKPSIKPVAPAVRQPPIYSNYQSAPASRQSAGYEANAKPYNDYTGVTYENEENEYEK